MAATTDNALYRFMYKTQLEEFAIQMWEKAADPDASYEVFVVVVWLFGCLVVVVVVVVFNQAMFFA